MPQVYEWYQQGLALIKAGDNHAAATVLERAAAAEPDKGSIREALARAYFGTGLCLGRLGRLKEALGHLRMANVMRPGNSDYEAAIARYEAWQRITSE